MSKKFELKAQQRAEAGKGASRRLRRLQNGVPAVIYGGDVPPASITLDQDKLFHAVANEAFFASIITLDIDGKKESVVIKDLQRHPAKPILMHADFQRVDAKHQLHVKVPLHFLNEETALGVKQGGGKVMHLITELEIHCLPKDLPEFIEVDIQNLNIGESLHISDLNLPEGVISVALSHGADSDLAVVQINKIKGKGGDAEEAEEAAE